MVFCSSLAAVFAHSVFVEQVLGHAVLGGAHAAQVGHPVGQLFDGLDLLVQEMRLEVVAQLRKKRTEAKNDELIMTRCRVALRMCAAPCAAPRYSHVGRCGRSTACAGPGGTGSRSSQAAGRIPGPLFRCPTHPALASAKKKKPRKTDWLTV